MPVDVEIPYSVSYASSRDASKDSGESSGFRTDYLNSKGWVSARMCDYPQELVIRFKKIMKINLIQILCHDQFISTKVDIYAGQPQNSRHSNPNPTLAVYKPIGDASFLPRPESRQPDKERRTIHASCSALFLKFVWHPPHKNRMNLGGQVGVHSIRVWGPKPEHLIYSSDSDPDDDMADRIKQRFVARDYDLPEVENAILNQDPHPMAPKSFKHPADPKNTRTLKDFAKKRQDDRGRLRTPFTVDLTKYKALLNLLKNKKEEAIRKEKYLEAGDLKNMVEYMEANERRMHYLNYQRKECIEHEDFETADQCKKEYEDLRRKSAKRMPKLPQYLNKTEREKHDVPSEYESSDSEEESDEEEQDGKSPRNRKKSDPKPKKSSKANEPWKDREEGEDLPISQSIYPDEDTVQQIIEMERNNDPNVDNVLDELIEDLNNNEQLHCDPRVQDVMRRREAAGVEFKINNAYQKRSAKPGTSNRSQGQRQTPAREYEKPWQEDNTNNSANNNTNNNTNNSANNNTNNNDNSNNAKPAKNSNRKDSNKDSNNRKDSNKDSNNRKDSNKDSNKNDENKAEKKDNKKKGGGCSLL